MLFPSSTLSHCCLKFHNIIFFCFWKLGCTENLKGTRNTKLHKTLWVKSCHRMKQAMMYHAWVRYWEVLKIHNLKLLKHCWCIAAGLKSEQANHNYGGMAVFVWARWLVSALCLSIYQILLFRLFLSKEQSSKTQPSPEVSEKSLKCNYIMEDWRRVFCYTFDK